MTESVLSKYTAKRLLDTLAERSASIEIAIHLGGTWWSIGKAQVNLLTGEEDNQKNVYELMIGEDLKDLGIDESMTEEQRSAVNAELDRLGIGPTAA